MPVNGLNESTSLARPTVNVDLVGASSNRGLPDAQISRVARPREAPGIAINEGRRP